MKHNQTHTFTSCQFHELFDMVEEAATPIHPDFTLPATLADYFEVQGA